MPWSSGRRDVINALQDVVSNLQRHLMRQFILTSAQYDPALGVGVGVDEDADEAILALRSGAESFMLAGYSVVNTLNESLARVLGSRYVVDRRSWRGLRGIRQDVLEYYFGMDENWFKEQIRVDRHGFFHLLNHIKDDDVFRNDSRNPQAPIEYQLMVALSHLGHHGNSNSARSVARQFRIAEGTTVLWTRRVIVAFLSLQDQWVVWPRPLAEGADRDPSGKEVRLGTQRRQRGRFTATA